MPARHRILSTGLVLALAASASQAAGSVSVTFVDPDKFADARDASLSAEGNLRVLAAHIESAAARHLPEGDKLSIEVLDVDLAGELWPSRRTQELRVLKGGADWPRIKLRYALESPGRPAQSAEQTISDLAYLQRGVGPSRQQALFHEKRMLDEWFERQFAARSPR